MNFLAHLYLSGNNPDIRIGNFIGDHVKGRAYLNFPPNVQKGILLHRQIDAFTDRHPMTKQSAEKLAAVYGKYAGVVIDVFYDHFLAVNWHHYSNQSLADFSSEIHALLARRYFSLPRDVRNFVPFLIANKRLESYARQEGLEKALSIMANYTSLPNRSADAIAVLNHHYDALNGEFLLFWDDMRRKVADLLKAGDAAQEES